MELDIAQIKRIRHILNLNEIPLTEIPDDMLMMALISKEGVAKLSPTFQKFLVSKYGRADYEYFEFIGDAVLEMIVTQALIDSGITKNPLIQSKYRELIVKNISLYCLTDSKGLCKEIIADESYPWKFCADFHEAIIGVIYYYLHHMVNRVDSFSILYNWYIKTWDLFRIIRSIETTGKIPCVVNGKYGNWTNWSPCVSGSQNRTRKCDNPFPSGGTQCSGSAVEYRSCSAPIVHPGSIYVDEGNNCQGYIPQDVHLNLFYVPYFNELANLISKHSLTYLSFYRPISNGYYGYIQLIDRYNMIKHIFCATSSDLKSISEHLTIRSINELKNL